MTLGLSLLKVIPGVSILIEVTMKQTRLSKFQHWLLCRCYQNMIEKDSHNPTDATVNKYEIYRDYYKLPCHTKGGYNVKAFFSESPGSAPAALSRSLRNLFEKGFVLDPKFFFAVVLTEQGIIKAKELLAP